MEKDKSVYIGDGVYVSNDGYHIWLSVNSHENKVVALEPNVMENLINYHKSLSNK